MNERLYPLTTDTRGNKISVRRDDLLPFSFGGNKVIIAKAQLDDMARKGYDIMIGYGNSRSNLCRVLATMCFSRGVKCMIISPLDDDDTFTPSFNNSFIKETNTEIVTCRKCEAGKVIAEVKKSCEAKGLKPYFVYDIDNVAAPVRAYSLEFADIAEKFDYIFLATGTGTTTAGILTGLIESKKAAPSDDILTKVVGISVARTCERELPVIDSYIATQGEDIRGYYRAHADELFTLCDKYVGHGYGSIEKDVEKVIRKSLLDYGMPLDPTYTGKAFFGMNEYIAENDISGKKILFWHTGGLPLFFDYFADNCRKDG